MFLYIHTVGIAPLALRAQGGISVEAGTQQLGQLRRWAFHLMHHSLQPLDHLLLTSAIGVVQAHLGITQR